MTRDSVRSRRGGMADAEDLKSSGGNPVWVQFPPPVINCDRFGVLMPLAQDERAIPIVWAIVSRSPGTG